MPFHEIRTKRKQDARLAQIFLHSLKQAYELKWNPELEHEYRITFYNSSLSEVQLYTSMSTYFWKWKDIQRTGIRDVLVNGELLK